MSSLKKGVPKNFAKFIEKHLCQSLFFNQVAGFRSATLLKKRLYHRCFPVNFAKFFRTPFYRTPLGDYFCKHLVYFTAQVPDTGDTSVTGATRMRHEHDTSETRAARVQHECYTNDTSATRVKIFYFDNNTSENIFSHPYNYYMATERL